MKKTIFLIGFYLMSTMVNASPITITSYDIDNANLSGTGAWTHTYSGTITPTSTSIANYSGGTGTLNDGVISSSVLNTQLFNYPTDSLPAITLNFDAFYSINNLLISGGNFLGNAIPGNITSLDITINSITENFSTASTGLTLGNRSADDFIDLSGSSLFNLSTNSILLSGFISSGFNGIQNTFSITEINLDGKTASVPEPASLGLLVLGFIGLVFSRRKKL